MALLKLPDYLPPAVWNPISDAQYTACHSEAQMLMFGGAAGPGKTSFIVADAVREYDNPNLRAIIFRESFPQLEKSVLPKMRDIYTQMGATFVGGRKRRWLFPSGAMVYVGVIAKKNDIGNYQGGEYSYIGFDESTYHPEAHLRDLLPWFRSTDSSLFKRIRLATNPGGQGAPWHQHVFLRNKCPFHNPNECVIPGAIYKGSTWLSDRKQIPYTISFIPGLHTDHTMHGPDYADSLRTQSGDRAEQFLKGCWCSLQGAYFKGMRPDIVMPYHMVPREWWWVHYLGFDYGYGNSAAAAGFYCVSPPTAQFPGGQHFKIGEFVARELLSKEFARAAAAAFTQPLRGHKPRIVAGYIDPANNQHDGTGKSNMEQMAEVLAPQEINLVPAANDPLGGSQRLAHMLASSELILTDLVPETYRALSSRMHDDKRPGCYKKIHGDAMDDIADETRYAVNTFTEESRQPRDEQIAARVKELQDAGLDERSILIHAWKMEQNLPREDAPVLMGGRNASFRGVPIIRR